MDGMWVTSQYCRQAQISRALAGRYSNWYGSNVTAGRKVQRHAAKYEAIIWRYESMYAESLFRREIPATVNGLEILIPELADAGVIPAAAAGVCSRQKSRNSILLLKQRSFCPAISPLPVHDFEYSSNSIFVVTPQDAGTAHEYPADR
jgi:hypothetical protein